MMIVIPSTAYRCIETLKKYARVELTFSQMKSVLESNIEFQITLSHWGCEDTAEREQLVDLVSNYVGAGDWPTNGEDRFDEFWKDFKKKAEVLGYKVLED